VLNNFRTRCFGARDRKTALRASRWSILVAIMVFSLSSCLVNRVVEIKEQFCDFDSNFNLQFDNSVDFRFNHPVLLDSDILWLSGASPTEIVQSEDELLMIFLIEKVMPASVQENDSGQNFRIDLNFDHFDEEYKLRQVRMDPKLKELINPELFDEEYISSMVRNVCDTGLNFAFTSMEMDISEQELNMLPDRQEILRLLGPPLEKVDQDTGLVYEYRVKGEQTDPNIARFTVWFDETGMKPVRVESRYFRYQTRADFLEKKMYIKVTI
jgi:hypothetical protein